MKQLIPLILLLLLLVACKTQDTTPQEECTSDEECVPAACCHATECVPKSQAPDCEGVMCTMECQPGTLDCGGSCTCEQGVCTANYAES